MIRVLLARPGLPAEATQVEPNLAEFQSIVGGYIEHHRLDDRTAFYCNEDGGRLGLPDNRVVLLGAGLTTIVGPMVVFGVFRGKEASLDEDSIRHWKRALDKGLIRARATG